MKTTLCLSCKFGLVREWEYYDTEVTGRQNKCLLGNDYIEVVTGCSRYEHVAFAKVTYHDPNFDTYERSIEANAKGEENVWKEKD